MKKAQAFGHFIGGKPVKSAGGQTFPSLNPANPSEVLGQFQSGTAEDVRAAVDAAERAFGPWSSLPAPRRGEILLKAAQLLRQRKEALARLVTLEMGKVLPEARGDVQEAIDVTEYMAGEGRRLFGHTTPSELPDKLCMTLRRPIGVCGLITPWNFPTAIPAWKITAALICGNTVVFKPASDTPLCAYKLVETLVDAGLPKGVVNLVTGAGETVGAEIVKHRKIRAISFTGSRSVGEFVLKNAGIKRVGLELGGKNAVIVMDDADLKLAVDGVIWGAFGTTGQRCTAASRVIVHKKVKQAFTRQLLARAWKLKAGNGLKPGTDLGPLINAAAVEKVHRYTQIGVDEGAGLLCGGKRLPGKGFFYPPTLFDNVQPGMRIAREEIFGPTLSVLECSSLKEAIALSNSIEYGLSSSIYTRDIRSAMKAIEGLEAGITYINSSTIGAEVHLPFGGVKASGNGTREGGIHGIDEFSETKTVYIDYSGRLQKAQIDVVKVKR